MARKYILFTFQLSLIVLTYVFVKFNIKMNRYGAPGTTNDQQETETGTGTEQQAGSSRQRAVSSEQGRLMIVLFDAGILSLMMALLSHLMWRATLVHLFIAHAGVLYLLYKGMLNRWLKYAFFASIALNTLTAQGFTGARASDWMEAMSCMTFGTLILYMVVFSGISLTGGRKLT
jgi:hypothetical protein